MHNCGPSWRKAFNDRLLIGLLLVCPSTSILAQSQLENSIITIYCDTSVGSSQGTGFVLGSQGLIVTAYHVVEDAKKCDLHDHEFNTLPGVTVEHIDPLHDIAILKSSKSGYLSGLKPVGVLPTAPVQIRVAGSPRGLPKQILFGRLTSFGTIQSIGMSAKNGDSIFAQDIEIYPVDVTIYGGMSGAPVIEDDQSVLGLFSGSYEEGRGIGWAIPMKYILDLQSQPSLGRDLAAMGAWPKLALMGPRWISLKRSYNKVFTSEHMAKLEILEQTLTGLQGTWYTGADRRSATSRCEALQKWRQIWTFDSVDQDKAALIGHLEANYLGTASPLDDAPQEKCNAWAFGDSSVSQQDAKLEGIVFLTVQRVGGFTDSPRLKVTANFSKCTGTNCTADQYGKHEMHDLEVISGEKLRMGTSILGKTP